MSGTGIGSAFAIGVNGKTSADVPVVQPPATGLRRIVVRTVQGLGVAVRVFLYIPGAIPLLVATLYWKVRSNTTGYAAAIAALKCQTPFWGAFSAKCPTNSAGRNGPPQSGASGKFERTGGTEGTSQAEQAAEFEETPPVEGEKAEEGTPSAEEPLPAGEPPPVEEPPPAEEQPPVEEPPSAKEPLQRRNHRK
jgi:hypothetical protein